MDTRRRSGDSDPGRNAAQRAPARGAVTAETRAHRGHRGASEGDAVDEQRSNADEEVTDRVPRSQVLKEGTLVDRYVLLAHLGSGGMGSVYAAWDPRLARRIAIKMLRSNPFAGAANGLRLEREGRALGRLNDEHVIRVFDVGEWNGAPFIAMELVEGKDITALITAERPSRERIVRLFVDAGRGLAAAHAVGVVHRDVKGENILVGDDGRARIGDFGIATFLGDDDDVPAPAATNDDGALRRRVTVDGAVLGTPGYMAPEQLQGHAVDARADQFAFCVAVWKAVFGSDPFPSAPSVVARFERMQQAPQTPARRWGALESVLARGLRFDAARRYPDMGALLAAMETALVRPRRIAQATVAFSVAVVVVAAAVAFHNRDVCGIRAARAGVETALAPIKAPLLRAALGPWLQRWENSAVAVCKRADLDDEARDARLACFDARRSDAEALVGLVAQGKATADDAVQAALALPTPELCVDVRQIVPAAGEHLATLSRARMAFSAGDVATAHAGAVRMLAALKDTDDRRLRAEGELLQGQVEMQRGAFSDAEKTLRRAVASAIAAGSPHVEAQAWTSLVELLGDRLKRRAEALALRPFMQAAVDRFPDDNDLEVERLIVEGYIGNEIGEKVTGERAVAAAVALALERRPVNPHSLGRAANLDAILLNQLGESRRAVEVLQRARDVLLTLLPPQHVRFAALHNSLGLARRRAGDLVGAREAFAAAVGVVEAQPRPADHAAIHGVPLTNLAALALQAGDIALAKSTATRARALLAGAIGEDGERVTWADDILALTAAAEGRFADARRHVADWNRRHATRDPGGWMHIRAQMMDILIVAEAGGQPGHVKTARARLAALEPTNSAGRASVALFAAALAAADGDRERAREALATADAENLDVTATSEERVLLAGLRLLLADGDRRLLPRHLPAGRLLLAARSR